MSQEFTEFNVSPFVSAFQRKQRKAQTVELANKEPVLEVINLRVTQQTIDLQKNFDGIWRIIWFMKYTAQNVNFDLFGVATALTNGLQVKFNTIDLLDQTIKTSADFWKYGYDVDPVPDGQGATANNILTARWSFNRFMPNGLNVLDKSRRLQFVVQDDLSSANDEIIVTVEGWRF